ncbi:NUDIX domain-containing protein [Candidatus Gracilibacteria bacterium]|nr:NUDIX domain-containing protein [Candidatus Gracilibacteria bacterium]
MSIPSLILSLEQHGRDFLIEKLYTDQTISWIREYEDFAFVKNNMRGHITGSMLITNLEKTKVLLMFHKKYQEWTQFGGHCDGETDVLAVATREFHEESGIIQEPGIFDDIFSVQMWDVSDRTSSSGIFQPAHHHYDIIYLAAISEDTLFARQESEVDDIRWFDIEGIEKYIGEKGMLDMIEKIKKLV